MKKLLAIAASALLALASIALNAGAQVQPSQFASGFTLVPAGTSTTGTFTATRAPAANKTFQVTSSVGTATGTTTVIVQGSNDATYWDTLTTMSVTSSVAGASTSTSTTDRYLWLRGNVTVLSGSTPTLKVTAGF